MNFLTLKYILHNVLQVATGIQLQIVLDRCFQFDLNLLFTQLAHFQRLHFSNFSYIIDSIWRKILNY